MIAMKIVGYDHNTESLAVEVPVPADAEGAARLIASVPAVDPDLSPPIRSPRIRCGRSRPWHRSQSSLAGFDYFLEADERHDG